MRRKTLLKRLLPVAAVLVCLAVINPLPVFSQDDAGGVSGVVYKKNKKTPLENARIKLTSVEKKWGKKEFVSEPTGEDGVFEVSGVPAGMYKVVVLTKNKKRLKTRTVVNVSSGKILKRDFHVKVKKGFFGGCAPCGISVLLIGLIFLI